MRRFKWILPFFLLAGVCLYQGTQGLGPLQGFATLAGLYFFVLAVQGVIDGVKDWRSSR